MFKFSEFALEVIEGQLLSLELVEGQFLILELAQGLSTDRKAGKATSGSESAFLNHKFLIGKLKNKFELLAVLNYEITNFLPPT